MESLFLQQVLNGLIVGSVYCLIAIGLTMIFGVMRIANFAHGDFSMLGAYFAIYFVLFLSGWAGWAGSLVVAAVGVGLIGFFVERFLFRPLLTRWTDIDIIMLSIGLFILLENGARLFFGATPKMISNYKEHGYTSSGGDHFEATRDSCPARSSGRRAALSRTDAGASLPGFFA